MDGSAPVARRTRGKEAELYRDLFEKRKKEKESSSNVGGSSGLKAGSSLGDGNVDLGSGSGVVVGEEEADFGYESMKDSPMVDTMGRHGTRDDPFCVDDDEEEKDSGSELEASSDDDYELESSSDDDGDGDSSDYSYDVYQDRGRRFYSPKRRKSVDFEMVDGNEELFDGIWSGEGEGYFTEEGHECNESMEEVYERKKRKERRSNEEKGHDCNRFRRESSEKKRKEKRGNEEASGSGSLNEGIGISEESFTGVKEGNNVDSAEKFCSESQRARLWSNSGRGKEKVGDGTVSQPFCIDLDDDDDGEEEEEVEESEEVICDNNNQEFRKRERTTQRKRKSEGKDYDVFQILVDSIYERRQLEDLVSHDKQPQVEVELPLKFNFGDEKPKPMDKSASELELDQLWEDLNLGLAACEIGSRHADMDENEDSLSENDADIDTLCRQGKHQLILDEQIGLICSCCSHVQVEIKNIVPSLEINPWGRSDYRDTGPNNHSILDRLGNQDSDFNSCSGNGFNGHVDTVWDLIPGVKKSMYPHQQEGFEFLWNKIAGGIHLQDLKGKDMEKSSGGEGCIISHAPGTGKTRLTIVFLQTYMKLYPKSLPVIIAPRSMLLTWEEEFHKWKVDIPFHNLNLQEISGKEDEVALNLLQQSCRHDQENVRMVKMYSWRKGGSILGITYRLFEQFVAEEKNTRGEQVRRILLDYPGLIVLDEGHTPRNNQSLIWQALSKVKTERRIVLSGTPFQNNFGELYNTLHLVRPRFAETFTQRQDGNSGLKHRDKKEGRKKWYELTRDIGKVAGNQMDDDSMKEIRLIIDSVAHIHKGTVLESLPGLRECVIILKPSQLQQSHLQGSQTKGNQFDKEYGESLVSVHPSLLLRTKAAKFLHEKEKLRLERLKLNPEAGVKTKFLVELIRLSEAVNEKVLVFSQYLDPLSLVMAQLKSHFKWSEMVDIFYMDGKRDVKQRQSLINAFNDPSSKVRVLLASTKACAEGINLVGASRVVLLDIVWNPSVERQAICRAFRLGQKKVVYIYRLITSGTMEEDKYSCQVEKDRLSKLVFSSSNRPSNHQKILPGVAEDRILEEMVQHDKLKNMFQKISFKEKESNLETSLFGDKQPVVSSASGSDL